jgi:hypothetical protein
MTALLRKRLKRIEAEVIEPVTAGGNVAIVFEPKKADTPEKWAQYQAKLEEAQRTSDQVFVIGMERSTRQQGPGSVIYEPFDPYRLGEIFAMKRGGKRELSTLIDDAMSGVSGNIITPNTRTSFPGADDE